MVLPFCFTGSTPLCSKVSLTVPKAKLDPISPRTGIKMTSSRSPGSVLGGVQIKSPSSGILRLGLSRNIRLKPLHPSANVSPR